MSLARIKKWLFGDPVQQEEKHQDYALVNRPDWTEPLKIELPPRKSEFLEIGNSPTCWLTIPDPNLPDVVARIFYASHHWMLQELPIENYHRAAEFDFDSIRAHRIGRYPLTVGDYEITIFHL